MNIMTDHWTVFGRDQGQTVEVAYRYDYDTDCIIRRTHDRSDNTIHYSAATYYEGPEWNGSEGTAPFDEDALEWTGCENPFEESQRTWNHSLGCWDDEVDQMIADSEAIAEIVDEAPGTIPHAR